MSMRHYAVDDYGLVVSKQILRDIASRICEDFSESEFDEDPYPFIELVTDKLGIDYISEFTGETIPLGDEGEDQWGTGEPYDVDTIYYCPTLRFPGLCRKAYPFMGAVYNEFEKRLGKYISEDYIRNNVRHITGTYFG